MRILDLGEAGYEGQTEAQKHYFRIEGDIDQERGINDLDCEEITKQLVGMGLQAYCQPDESRNDVVQIDTYSGRTTVADALARAGYEADAVGDPSSMAIEQAISETSKFTKADFEENEDKNYHTENGVELAKAFGTPDEIKHMEQIAKNHYTRGHILPDEIEARNVIVSKYFPSLESQEEAMSKMEGDGRKKGMHPKGHPMRQKQQAAIHANEATDGSELAEDIEDETKTIRLKMMQQQVEDLKSNFEILTRLDQRGTGAGDLQDQITTMYKAIGSLEGVLGRSLKIVPEEIEVNEFDIKKSFNNIANNVKNTMSNVVKGNPLRNKMNKSANKNGPSLARQINWGGKYESEDLNELDMFAPKTDFVKSPDGEYYKIEYRNNSSMTGRRKDDKARFVSIVPASEKEVNALDLEAMIGKGKSDIHTGHEVQGGHPFSDRNMAVYKYGTDDYEEEIPNNAKLKLIKVMTTEAEKNKKAKLGTKIRSWQETKADMKKKIEASKPGDKK